MNGEQVVWRTAHPLWRPSTEPRHSGSAAFERPAVLRFTGESFMEAFQAAVTAGGDGLAPFVAGAETWEEPGAGLGTPHEAEPTTAITLFQPVHARYYLVTASLVCRRYGHPDRRVATDRGERVAFLLRRLVPNGAADVDPTDPRTFTEYAWVDETWRPASAVSVPDGEQRLPLFTVTADADGTPRRLLTGLIPVSGRETFATAATLTADGNGDGNGDPLAALADARLRPLVPIIEGLQALLDRKQEQEDDDVNVDMAIVRESLFFGLVDLAAWLQTHLPASYDGDPDAPPLNLGKPFLDDTDWREALTTASDNAGATFDPDTPDPEPVRRFTAVTDPLGKVETAIIELGVTSGNEPTGTDFFGKVVDALEALEEPATEPPADEDGSPDPSDPRAVYVARFLYERDCTPSALRRAGAAPGAFRQRELSAPSRPFRLGAFHEPGAPFRDVKINMPVDVSPGGLRNFPRTAAVAVSAELRKQMSRVTKDSLKGDFDSAKPVGLAVIWQLSIPIISICALVLLMAMVLVLNTIFYWLPYFMIPIPVPRGGRR